MVNKYNEVNGNLITLALDGKFDVIVHGCNCFCKMGAGLAPKMVKAFRVNTFNLENKKYAGWVGKLGNIDFKGFNLSSGKLLNNKITRLNDPFSKGADLIVVNAYSQYKYGINRIGGVHNPIDYEALTLCLRKMNLIFKGKRIGLPLIGCGLAGGDEKKVIKIIQDELSECIVTIVRYDGT